VVDALLLSLLLRVRRHCHHHAVHHHVPGNLSETGIRACVLVGLLLDRYVSLNLMLRSIGNSPRPLSSRGQLRRLTEPAWRSR
jgi:hypothetical protein